MSNKEVIEQRIIKKKPLTSHKKTSISDEDDDEHKENNDDSDDEVSLNRTKSSSSIKYLPPSVRKDIDQKNMARKLAGLPAILISIRPCLTCGSLFESSGNRTCGCASRVAGIIAGREII